MHRRARIALRAALIGMLASTTTAVAAPMQHDAPLPGAPVPAKGAMTCDFGLPADLPVEQLAPTIERDRIYMARRSGMLRKHIPFRPDAPTRTIRSGGRYLFATQGQAQAYLHWARTQFVLDGVQFFDRDIFIDPDCHAWRTIGAHDLAPLETSQVVLRTERWQVPAGDHRAVLEDLWPVLLHDAAERGLSGVWLLYGPTERLVQVVYFAPHTYGQHDGFDPVALAVLEAAPPLGAPHVPADWVPVMDLTQWTLTIWFPNPCPHGDCGPPSLWPNSPPLPTPTTTDGVCVPSRGEDHRSAPDDCVPTCGDGRWQREIEDNRSCPSDAPYG